MWGNGEQLFLDGLFQNERWPINLALSSNWSHITIPKEKERTARAEQSLPMWPTHVCPAVQGSQSWILNLDVSD